MHNTVNTDISWKINSFKNKLPVELWLCVFVCLSMCVCVFVCVRKTFIIAMENEVKLNFSTAYFWTDIQLHESTNAHHTHILIHINAVFYGPPVNHQTLFSVRIFNYFPSVIFYY